MSVAVRMIKEAEWWNEAIAVSTPCRHQTQRTDGVMLEHFQQSSAIQETKLRSTVMIPKVEFKAAHLAHRRSEDRKADRIN
jgi:hypothetical protein